MARVSWEKRLTVDKRIVRLLSARTYEDFPGAIREMVSNAYDADATEVDMRISPREDLIVVSDNGNGMTPDDFDFFLRIAGQTRGRDISPEFRRRRIGQFGIGFLAMFPFGKRIRVTSSARHSDVRFEATVATQQFFKDERQKVDVEDIPIPGYEVRDPKLIDEHGTAIRIEGLSDLARAYFRGAGLDIPRSRKSVRGWPPMERLEWSLSEDLPLDYRADSPYHEALADLGTSGLKVRLNGRQLFRHAHGAAILENKEWTYNEVRCRYVIATAWKSISPAEARYLKQRLRNVGIGDRNSFGLGLIGRAYSRLHWLTGEIHILEGLDSLLSIDRAKFIEGPEYEQFREYFRGRLAYFANYVEDVSEAERDIRRQLRGSRAAEVGSKQEVIARNVERLKAKGFAVVRKPSAQTARRTTPVTVDVKSRTVVVVDDHPDLQDRVTVGRKSYPVRYLRWEPESGEPAAVRKAKDGVVEVNTDYPLFKSRRYGEVLKKTFIVALVLSEKVDSPQGLVIRLAEELGRELGDLE